MAQEEARVTTEIQRTIDREAKLLTEAIYMVAAGHAPSTTIAGLRLGEAAMAVVGPLAAEQGVVLEALWSGDEGGIDVRVRRPAEA
jgi:hypothetical protein